MANQQADRGFTSVGANCWNVNVFTFTVVHIHSLASYGSELAAVHLFVLLESYKSRALTTANKRLFFH